MRYCRVSFPYIRRLRTALNIDIRFVTRPSIAKRPLITVFVVRDMDIHLIFSITRMATGSLSRHTRRDVLLRRLFLEHIRSPRSTFAMHVVLRSSNIGGRSLSNRYIRQRFMFCLSARLHSQARRR